MVRSVTPTLSAAHDFKLYEHLLSVARRERRTHLLLEAPLQPFYVSAPNVRRSISAWRRSPYFAFCFPRSASLLGGARARTKPSSLRSS